MAPFARNSMRFPVFQDSGFEFGIESGPGHHQVPYVAWREGDAVVTVVGKCGNGANFHRATIDELLLKLAKRHSDAAKWLISQCPALDQPKETILALCAEGIIYGEVSGDTIDILHPGSAAFLESITILSRYDWHRAESHQPIGSDNFVYLG